MKCDERNKTMPTGGGLGNRKNVKTIDEFMREHCRVAAAGLLLLVLQADR